MAAERIERFVSLIKKNKPFAIVFGLCVLGLLIIFSLLIKEIITLGILSSVPWCEVEKTKCGGQGYHIGCHPEHYPVNSDCLNINLVHMDKHLKGTILKKHNEIRNAAAGGFYEYNLVNKTNQLNLPKASRLREVVWDHQLQLVAELHAKTCTSEHDQCRSTQNYSYVGQNFGHKNSPKKDSEAIDRVSSIITGWYDERFTVDPKIIEKFLDELNHNNLHYLLMVNEKVEKIGCAYITYEKGKKKKTKLYGFQLTCNYSYSNMIYSPVYKSGEPKSDCGSLNSHGISIYKYLCGPMAKK